MMETLKAFLLNFAKKSLGGGLILLMLALGLAIFSYNPWDPSWNVAGGDGAENLMGEFGAYASDALLQGLGFGSWALLWIFLFWGRALWAGAEQIAFTKKRLFGAILALLLISGALHSLQGTFQEIEGVFSAEGAERSWGGVAGNILFQNLSIIIPQQIEVYTGFLLSALLVPLGIFVLFWVSGITSTQIVQFAFTLFSFSQKVMGRAQALLSREQEGDDDFYDHPKTAEPSFETEVDPRPSPTAEIKKPQASQLSKVKVSQGSLFDAPRTTEGAEMLPPIDLLQTTSSGESQKEPSKALLAEQGERLSQVLADFGIRGEIVDARPGPVVSLFEFVPAAGVKSSRVIALSDDIARSMSALSARVSVIAGRNALGIELPNPKRQMVSLRELIESPIYDETKEDLPLVLGKDIGGKPVVADLARMPHLLVAGTTGSGKSVAINTMILSLLYHYSPEKCKFIMVDPKMLELSVYNGIPHLLTPVVTEPKKAVVALKWAVKEMEDRYRAMSQLGVRNVHNYNTRLKEAADRGEDISRRVQTGVDPDSGKPIFETQSLDLKPLPFIVVIVDEMADLMLVAGKEVEAAIQRLAQMARAAGIHLIMATQRPSVDVITGTIKANFPTRISFQVTSKIDSRTILGEPGAEQLLGKGDMLYMAGGGRITRIHGPFVSDREVEQVVKYLGQVGTPEYISTIVESSGVDDLGGPGGAGSSSEDRDPLYDQVVALLAREKKASTSFVQRHFQIGYNRAARIIDQLEADGVVSEPNHVGRRKVLLPEAQEAS